MSEVFGDEDEIKVDEPDAMTEMSRAMNEAAMNHYIEFVASVCHEVNRVFCAYRRDYSQMPWESAPKWARDSAIDGVRNFVDNPDITPEMSHENWMRKKTEDGWKWGPTKDPAKKEHPCMIPYNRLPDEQRVKDELFVAICRRMLRRA